MRRFAGVATRAILVLLVGLFGAGAASAASVNCTGSLTGTFDSVIVPANTECDVGAATINGSINVQAGASLVMYGPATVKGNINAYGSYVVEIYNQPPPESPTLVTNKNATVAGKSEVVASNNVLGNVNISNYTLGVLICGAYVGGNVLITGSQGPEVFFGGSYESGSVCDQYGGGNVVAGAVSIQNSNTYAFNVSDNVVGHGMNVSGNFGPANKIVFDNSVAGTLACFKNVGTFNASGNSATTAAGQCAGKEGPPP
jgi:hypothetical protein